MFCININREWAIFIYECVVSLHPPLPPSLLSLPPPLSLPPHPSLPNTLPPSIKSIPSFRVDAMGRIRMLLIDAEHAEAVSLYRAARCGNN